MVTQTSAFSHRPHFKGLSFRKWENTIALVLSLAAVICGVLTYSALTATGPFEGKTGAVIWLLNLDLIILALLMILIARRIAGLFLGRRSGKASSRLQVRLILVFSALAATPAIIMTIFTALFLHYGVQTWFSERISTAVDAAEAVSEAYMEEHQQVIRADVLAMASDLDRQAAQQFMTQPMLERIVQTQSLLRNLPETVVLERDGRVVARSTLTFTLQFENIPTYAFERADNGEVVLLTGSEDRIRALVALNNYPDSYLFVGRMIDPAVISQLETSQRAVEEYGQLKSQYAGLQITITLIFVVIALMLLFTAIWAGLVFAKRLSIPISALVTAAERVRAGDLTARVSDNDSIHEFTTLAKSFNRMTSQLQEQRDELMTANRLLDQRRRFTETVLSGVSAGIVGLDKAGTISLANGSAAKLFGMSVKDLVGKPIEAIMPDVTPLLEQAYARPAKSVQAELPYETSEDIKKIFHVRLVADQEGDVEQGAVLTFDDITALQSAQRKAAWADVARRIAHEIKNPLTPIQLSAERLKRRYLKEVQTEPEVFSQCTDTIIKHVDDIGRMVNEFSSFARMPEPIIRPEHITAHVKDTLLLQKQAYPHITFSPVQVEPGLEETLVECDSQQVRQAVTNLLQNAIDSVTERIEKQKEKSEDVRPGRIDVHVSKHGQDVLVSVTDNGLGLPKDEAPERLTEPYVTRRQKGTGLGLAIVKKIMEDHKGEVQLGAEAWMKDIPGWEDLGGATVSLAFPMGEAVEHMAAAE